MKQIVFFDEIDKTMLPLVGGKGANLGEMTRAGFPVPKGFCLTTEVYDAFAAGLQLEELAGEKARSILEKRGLPARCEAQIQHALKQFPEGTLFSVRSSATAEDLPYASFAGQQDTFLNVTARDIAKAVKRCFISLYTDRAVSYRRQNGIEKPSMSVVIQEMVASDSSGVMFTADPVSGNRTRLVIDAVFGLGEAIVSGLVSPDRIVYDRKGKSILSEDIAKKEFAIRPLPGGETRREEIQSEEPVLTEMQIRKLVVLGEALEDHYGHPQDVEWAFQEGRLYLLQTRAITSLYPVPEFKDNKFHFLYNMGYQQMNPQAMPAMALDCLCGATNIRGDDLLKYKPSIFRPVGQHLFADLSTIMWIKPLRKFYMQKASDIVDPYLESTLSELMGRGEKLHHPDPAMRKLMAKAARALPKASRSKDPAKTAAEMTATLKQRSDKAIAEIEAAADDPDALRVIFKNCLIVDSLLDPFLPTLLAGILALKRLKELEQKMDCEGVYTGDIQIGNEGNVVTEMNLCLGDLADLASESPEILQLLREGGEDLKEKLLARQDAFGDTYRAFMRQYGFRCAGEIDISKPRWLEDPSPLAAQILAMSKDKEPGAHRREYEEKNRRAYEQGEALIQEIEKKLGARSAKGAREDLEQFRAYCTKREHLKYYWMRTFDVVQMKLLEIGSQLAENDQIDCAEDIMHLHMMDVYDALLSEDDLRPTVEKNRLEFNRVSRLTPPRMLTSEGEVIMGSLSRDGLPEGALIGAGVSGGSVEGIAKVITDPSGASIEKGEILIAPYTDPGWTPLFVDAAAVVTEIGGALTHGAVVAREYGIPGVVGVRDATKLIQSGQRIRVDGTDGYIMIVDL